MPNLASIDLNLLWVLHVVLEEKSATKAAKRLHVTQSAVSNSLARLRAVFDDPLLVRTTSGLVATPRALSLAPHLAAAVVQLRAVVESEGAFDPKTSAKRFTIACADYHEVVLLPRLIERVADRLPSASLRVVALDAAAVASALAAGDIDVLLGAPTTVPPGCLAEDLFEDGVVCVVRQEHPLAVKSVRAAELARWPSISVVVEDQAWVEDALRAAGLSIPKAALTVPHFTVAALAAARTDYVLPFPRLLARALEHLGLRALRVRDIDAPLATRLIWHARGDADPASRFFRDLIRTTARDVAR